MPTNNTQGNYVSTSQGKKKQYTQIEYFYELAACLLPNQ